MDYYFQDQLRWTYGFDNPNKTAAFLATLLPFLWIAYALAWKIPKSLWKWILIVLSATILLIGWWVLIKTYSRGGLVAATAASGYIFWQMRREWKWPTLKSAISLGLFIIIGIFVWSSGAGQRGTQWIGGHEGSVENRFELWQGALRMIASIPQGVGTGNSGNYYMQWFQPLASASSYRTLVNSYLTWGAEQGLLILGLSFCASFALWICTRSLAADSDVSKLIVGGCRASLISFVVSGFFTTTMEEPVLWLAPVVFALTLIVFSVVNRRATNWLGLLAVAGIVSISLCGVIFFGGKWLGRNTPLAISMQKESGGKDYILVVPSNPSQQPLRLAVDEAVMGQGYGKLIRRLAIGKNIQVAASTYSDDKISGPWTLAAGNQVSNLSLSTNDHCILLAPSVIDDVDAEKILHQTQSLKIMLPDFDEDGRVAFWKEKIEQSGRKDITEIPLPGTGSKVEWAWETVMDEIAH